MLLVYGDKPVPGSQGPAITTSMTPKESFTLQWYCADKNVLEIGSLLGHSTCAIGRVCKHLTSIDPHDGRGVWGDTWARCRANLEAHEVLDRVLTIRDFSYNVIPHLPENYFDVVWIDGDHAGHAVRQDAELALSVVKRAGGVIMFHDYGEDTCQEVAPTINSLYDAGMLGTWSDQSDTVAAFCLL